MGYFIKPKITLTGYNVQYVDLREPKPRATHSEIFVLDAGTIDAASCVGMDVPELIKQRYERGGYHVCTVERVKCKRHATISLQDLWQQEKAPCTPADQSDVQEA